MITRRESFIALAGLLVAPAIVYAQAQSKIWRVGFLSVRHVDFADTDYYYGPFRQGMRELGYVEGKNLVIEWRAAEGKLERVAGLAAELVNLKVDVIVAGGPLPASAAKKATTTIPIIFGGGADPVGAGLVKSLARPSGNITGLSSLGEDISAKLLEMLLAMVPNLARVAVLGNANSGVILRGIQAAAQRTGTTILPVNAGTASEIEQAFSAMTRDKVGALIVAREPRLNQQVRLIADLAAKHKLPSIGGLREYADAGGLLSYGASVRDMYRRAATYVDKIFKGAKPADLPVEQPTVFELVINGKTAKALGLTIPQALLISANEVLK